jgi:hypothetical protein
LSNYKDNLYELQDNCLQTLVNIFSDHFAIKGLHLNDLIQKLHVVDIERPLGVRLQDLVNLYANANASMVNFAVRLAITLVPIKILSRGFLYEFPIGHIIS